MRVIIGNGKVSRIIRSAGDVILSHSDIEVRDVSAVNAMISTFPKDTVVINTASKINLEWCEDNKQEAFDVNTIGARNVGEACARHGHHLVHISSGCIFDGMETEKVFTEEDTPSPAAWYTHTKAEADKILLESRYDKITILRPRQLISAVPNPTNMLTKFLNMKEGDFFDSPNSIICIEDMKEMIDHLVRRKCYGIYNLANAGLTSPYKIALKIKNEINTNFIVRKTSYEDYLKTLKVKRVNTILSIDKLVSTGFKQRNAEDALDWCLKNYDVKSEIV